MNSEKIIAAQDAAKMLISAFCDLEQTFSDFADMNIEEQEGRRWIKPSERVPADGVLVVVKTKGGAIYFGGAYKGKLMSNVEYWYPLPE